MEIKGLSDARIIKFFSKSPIKSFSAVLDALRYLDGRFIAEDIEYELFGDALGDNSQRKAKVRYPQIKGITSNALFRLTQLLLKERFVMRRIRKIDNPMDDEENPESVAEYRLTKTGKQLISILAQLDLAKQMINICRS